MKFYLYLLLAGASMLSFAAFLSPPFSFYPILRAFIFCLSIFSIVLFWRRNQFLFLLFFLSLGILYNPFLPISFSKAIQMTIHIVSAFFLIFIGFRSQR